MAKRLLLQEEGPLQTPPAETHPPQHSIVRNWADLEADAHREWEAQHPSTWERFKDAIRYGWEKVTGGTTGE